jgi:signal transduction histidine kinase
MKNPKSWLKTWIIVWLGLTFLSIVVVYKWQIREAGVRINALGTMAQRQQEADALLLDLERYRRENAVFRKLTPEEITATKERLKAEVARRIGLMRSLDADTEEQDLGKGVIAGTTALMIESARIEPKIFSKDVYTKAEIRDLHASIVEKIEKIRSKTAKQIADFPGLERRQNENFFRLLVLLAAQGFGCVFLIFASQYFTHTLPLQQVHDRMIKLKKGESPPPRNDKWFRKLTGIYQQLDATLTELFALVETQRRERHQFLMAVSTDLRPPLIMLQNGITRFAAGEKVPTEILTRSAHRISRMLDSLTDLVDIDRRDLRLNEEIVDLSQLLQQSASILGGPNSLHPLRTSTPKEPLWILLDSKRFESVLINLVSKIIQHFPQGCPIDLSIRKPECLEKNGVEILVCQGHPSSVEPPPAPATAPDCDSPESRARRIACGPKLDVLQHWISENGFGMLLAQRIMQAHGGSLRVAGLSGVGLEFSIYLPRDRIATVSTPTGMSSLGLTRALELHRIEPMLPEQAINLRS